MKNLFKFLITLFFISCNSGEYNNKIVLNNNGNLFVLTEKQEMINDAYHSTMTLEISSDSITELFVDDPVDTVFGDNQDKYSVIHHAKDFTKQIHITADSIFIIYGFDTIKHFVNKDKVDELIVEEGLKILESKKDYFKSSYQFMEDKFNLILDTLANVWLRKSQDIELFEEGNNVTLILILNYNERFSATSKDNKLGNQVEDRILYEYTTPMESISIEGYMDSLVIRRKKESAYDEYNVFTDKMGIFSRSIVSRCNSILRESSSSFREVKVSYYQWQANKVIDQMEELIIKK